MSDQVLDQLVDRAKYESDGDFAGKILDDIFAKYEKVNNLKISLSADSSFKAASDTVKAAKKSQDELSLSVTAYNKILSDTAKNQATSNALTSEAARTAVTTKQALADQRKELELGVKAEQAQSNSRNEAKAIIASLTQQRDKLSAADENGKQKIDELNQEIDKQNAFLEATGSSLEKRKINIGNYIGAVNILRPALEAAAADLAKLTANGETAGERYESLQKEVGLLTQVIERQDAGFKTLNAELRSNQQALQQMRAAGLEGTEAFEKLRAVVNKAQDDFNDFKEAQSALGKGEAEAGVNGLVKALQGLVGVYGAAVSAQTLFGTENEELNKSMQKLQAVLVLLNSVQQISTAIGEREAIVAGIQAGARKAMAVATEVYTFVTEAATAATFAFRAALVATGVGAVLVFLVSFTQELIKAANSTKAALDQLDKYNSALGEFYDILSKNNDEFLKYQGLNKKALEDQLSVLESQGAGFRELQAVKSKIAEEDAKNSADGLENLGLTRSDVEQLRDSYDRLGTELQGYEDIRQKAAKAAKDAGNNPDDDRGVKNATNYINSLKASQDAILKQIEPAEKLIEINDKATESQKQLAAETEKYNNEQAANLRLDTTKNRLDAIIAANAAIVANERKTEADRLSAIRAGADAEIALEQAQLTRKLATPGLSDEEKIIAAQDAAAAISAINIKAKQDDLVLSRQYDEAEYQFRLSILKQEATDQITRDQLVISNEKATFDQRSAANTDAYNKRRSIATAEYFNTLHDQTTTEAQRLEASKKFDSDVLAADIDFSNNRRQIAADNAEKLLQDGIAAQKRLLTAIKQKYQDATDAINDQYTSRKLNESQYQRAITAIQDQEATESLQNEVTTAFLKVNATKEGTKERADAEADLTDKVRALKNQEVKDFKDAEKAKQEAALETVDKIQTIYTDITGLISSALDAQATAQKNAIQGQITAVQDKAKADIDAENTSGDAAEVKAAKIATINAKAASDQQDLARKQKQIDIEKAQTDKIIAEGQIILSTAKAVAADLTQPWKIPFDIALGAAQLAIAIAAPVPTYFAGTKDHPGGDMIVGDGGRSELIQLPDGSMYITPATDTYIHNAPAHTVVHPDADKFIRDLGSPVVYSPSSESDNGLSRVLIGEMRSIKKAIQDKEELHLGTNMNGFFAIHQYGNSFLSYVTENVQFK